MPSPRRLVALILPPISFQRWLTLNYFAFSLTIHPLPFCLNMNSMEEVFSERARPRTGENMIWLCKTWYPRKCLISKFKRKFFWIEDRFQVWKWNPLTQLQFCEPFKCVQNFGVKLRSWKFCDAHRKLFDMSFIHEICIAYIDLDIFRGLFRGLFRALFGGNIPLPHHHHHNNHHQHDVVLILCAC